MSDKQLLIKTYNEQLRQIKAVNALIENNKKNLENVNKNREIIEEVVRRAKEEKEKQEQRDEEARFLENLVLKAETLAARENSSQNSTPEAREINNKIEQEFNEVYSIEAAITQLKLDVSTFQQDIDTIKKERKVKHDLSTTKLTSMYSNIQQLREESSQMRISNLQTLINNQNQEVKTEAEVQRLQTLSMLYKQLNSTISSEITAINSQETSGMVIETELNKTCNLLKQIPDHEIDTEEQSNALAKENEDILNNIEEQERKIMSSISVMAKEEDKQDDLANQLKDCQRKIKNLLETLRQQENLCNGIEKTIQDMKEQDATKKDKALAELDTLKANIIELSQENSQMRNKIDMLRSGQITKTISDSPVDLLCGRIQKSTAELEKETEQLLKEEEELKEKKREEELKEGAHDSTIEEESSKREEQSEKKEGAHNSTIEEESSKREEQSEKKGGAHDSTIEEESSKREEQSES